MTREEVDRLKPGDKVTWNGWETRKGEVTQLLGKAFEVRWDSGKVSTFSYNSSACQALSMTPVAEGDRHVDPDR